MGTCVVFTSQVSFDGQSKINVLIDLYGSAIYSHGLESRQIVLQVEGLFCIFVLFSFCGTVFILTIIASDDSFNLVTISTPSCTSVLLICGHVVQVLPHETPTVLCTSGAV